MPDVYDPMDTTRASNFYIACNRKATQMRFASEMFDRYTTRLAAIDSYQEMDRFLDGLDLKASFRDFARTKDRINATEAEWNETAPYLVPQLRALIARYSKLGDNAFYKYYLPVDDTVQKALELIP
jgi:carboxyl-terminal processing protease